MKTFDDREQAFENRFKYDEDQKFKVLSRRARLVGLWAAEKLGITGDAAEEYALTVVHADLEEPGYQDIIRKFRADFDAKGVDVSDHRIERELERQLEIARQQVATGEV
ncbi:DUF1476 family protein [uncultured Gammaproteobacteria bacterium]